MEWSEKTPKKDALTLFFFERQSEKHERHLHAQ
jgi:hypothetical protein